MSKQKSTSWLDRPVIKGTGLNWEQALYILIIVACLVSRLTMLGYRVQSHDESLHTQHSWYLYAGTQQGYQHNPMMHGPFLFHATAFSYFLFGDNDYTARLPVALMGTLLVAFPYLLRRYMGRGGALMASLLFLISPSFTYYSRYIRMDIPVILFTMVVVWAMFRYLEEGKGKHLYILAAGLSLMYATKEVAPIYTILFAVFLMGRFVIRALKQPWRDRGVEIVFTAALVVAVIGLLVLSAGWLLSRPGPEQVGVAEMTPSEEGLEASLPSWASAGGLLTILSLAVAGGALLYNLKGKLHTFRSFDLIVVIGTLCLPFASALPIAAASKVGTFVVGRAADPEMVSMFWSNLANLRPLNYNAPDIYYSGFILLMIILAAIAIGLAWDWRRWSIAAAIHTAIFLILFTTFFTNGSGIASGWVGSVGYWLEQQEVERGGQPWFYYLVVLPIYDFLPLIGALVAPIFLAVRGLLSLLQGEATDSSPEPLDELEEPEPSPPPPARIGATFVGFLFLWVGFSWLAYTYAGERMAWLVLHISLPMILVTGWLLGRLVEAVDWREVRQQHGWLLVLLLPAMAAALASFFRAGIQNPFQGTELTQLMVTGTFLGGLAGILFVGLLVALLWIRNGGRNGLLLTLLTAFLALGLLTVHVAYRFSFVNFDRPAEFLVYAHEGPDVRTTMEQLEELSLRVGGGSQLIDVTYGPEGSWPFYWYLRDYPNARYYGEQPTREQVLATAIIAGQPQWGVVEPYLGDDYYTFDYFFLWWPIEDYRQLTWEKVRDWVSDPQKRAALWRIFYDMDYSLYDEITGTVHMSDSWPLHRPYRLYVRKDVANRIWNFGVGPVAGVSEPEPDPYTENWQMLAARQVWGAEGAGPGFFSWPRGIAISPDGFVYVADSQNHRIQQFTLDGTFVTAWGTYGDCGTMIPGPGTFCEPWDVAVGPDGSVYVADTWGHRIQKFSADGVFQLQWGLFGQFNPGDPLGEGMFYGPRSIAVADDGLVYVTDTGNKRVQVFTSEGEFVREFGESGSAMGQFDEPVGLAVGPAGEIYVADSWNLRMQVLEPDGAPLMSWPIEGWNNQNVDEKSYVAVDEQGHIYVSDPGHYRILVFDSTGGYLYSFGQFGFDDTSFALPMGVAVGPDGALYITDVANHRVMVFDLP